MDDPTAPPTGAWIRLADLKQQWLQDEAEPALRQLLRDAGQEARLPELLAVAAEIFDSYAARQRGQLN